MSSANPYIKNALAGLLITLFFLGSTPSTSSALDLEGRIIRTIEIEAEVGITREVIQRVAGIEPGMPYSAARIRNGLEALYQTALFNDIQVYAERVDEEVSLRYAFLEKTYLASLRIKGNWKHWNREILDALGIQVGDEFVEDRWKRAVSRLMAFYQAEGHFQIKVTSEINRPEETNQIHIVLRIHEGQRARIREIKFTGNMIFSETRLHTLFLLGYRKGELYSVDQVQKIMSKLETWYQTRGYLRVHIGPPSVSYHPLENEISLQIPIDAEERVEVHFEGNHSVSTQNLEDLLLFREEHSYDESIMSAIGDRIKARYHTLGFPFADVRWIRRDDLKENTVFAIFIIQEGPMVCLRSILIEGNQQFSTNRLADHLTVPTRLSFLRCDRISDKLLDQSIKRIVMAYQEKGFLDVKVEGSIAYPEHIQSLRTAKADLVFKVQEGTQTSVEEIRFSGNESFPETDLARLVNLIAGSPYDQEEAGKGRSQIHQFYLRNGFAYSTVKLSEEFLDDRSRIILTYTIQEDQLVRVGSIFIEGNTFTKDHIIQREIKIQPGDPYNEEKIQLTRHKISRLRYLGDVRFRPVHPIDTEKKESIKDLRLSVRERPPKVLELGVGYGNEDRFRGFVGISHRNLGGLGRSISLRVESSDVKSRAVLTFIEPWLFSYPMDAKVVGEYQIQKRPVYDLESIGVSMGIDKDISETIRVSLKYQIESDNFSNVDLGVSEEEDPGRITIATLNPLFILDTRDDHFNPHRGSLHSVLFRLGALSIGSEAQIRKMTVESTWLFPITPWAVFVLSGRVGGVERFSETKEVPPSELFFLGGRGSVRGYRQDELGIVGDTINPDTGNPTGGKIFLIGNAELRLSLGAGLGFAVFNDNGNVWFSNRDNLGRPQEIRLGEVRLRDLRSTIGGGLRYNTPVGPLRLDVGYKLDRERNLCPNCGTRIEEDPFEIHFTLGHAF